MPRHIGGITEACQKLPDACQKHARSISEALQIASKHVQSMPASMPEATKIMPKVTRLPKTCRLSSFNPHKMIQFIAMIIDKKLVFLSQKTSISISFFFFLFFNFLTLSFLLFTYPCNVYIFNIWIKCFLNLFGFNILRILI